jgi:predicted dehydrogenase
MASDKALRVGVIGCGNIAQHAHLPSIHRTEGERLVAVADNFEDLARAVARRYGLEEKDAHADWRALIARKDIDAVVNLSLTPAHAETTIAALEAGKHVLVEKPMAVTSEEARRMAGAAARTGRTLMIAFNHTYDPAAEYVKALIERGELGEILHAEVFFYDDRDAWDAGALRRSLASAQPKPKWWPEDPRLGLLHYIHNYDSHVINLMRYLLGEPAGLDYCRWTPWKQLCAVFDYGAYRAVFKNVHTKQRRFEKGIEVAGTKKRAIIELAPPLERYAPGRVTVIDAEAQTVTQPLLEYRWPFEREHEHFVACLRDGTKPRTDGASCVADVAIAEDLVRRAMGDRA